MTVVVYIENDGSKIPKSSLAAISAGLEIKTRHRISRVVGLLLSGVNSDGLAKEASGFGLDEVLYVTDPNLTNYIAGQYVAVVSAALKEISDFSVVVAASTSQGKDLFPRVAEKFDAGQVSDAVEILDGGKFRRPMYAGNIIADVEVASPIKVVTVRVSAFAPSVAKTESCPVREIKILVEKYVKAEFIKFESVKSERPELTEAEIVVSGGRALLSAENFERIITPLADALGAAIGASRAAVDSGYAPNDWQVGQTGKVVAPKLYIAVGISGAIQHLAGMKDSRVIVAINKDPEAPIFEVADYGLVGDLFDIVPKLTASIKQLR